MLNSITKLAQQVFLKTFLKTVPSAGWGALAILALPSFAIAFKYFFAKRTLAICSKNEVATTDKVDQVVSNAILDRNSFETVLNQWCSEDPEKYRVLAKEKIWNFYVSIQETILDLSYLHLTSLPNIFHLEPFQSRLIRLNLSHNKLIRLPDSFGDLKALIKVNLSSNKLESLPDSFSELQVLAELYISYNELTKLPNSFGKLQALIELNLSDNKLTYLPDSFGDLQALIGVNLSDNELTCLPDSFGKLQALTGMNLSDNELTHLPDSFGKLQALIEADLSGNQLTHLPDSFGKLHALTNLNLSYNELTKLPDCFGNLRRLTHLYLNSNKLRNVPDFFSNLQTLRTLHLQFNFTLSGLSMQILNLSTGCTIDVTGCSLSQTALENIREIITQPTYAGPRINFSMPNRNRREEKSIEESLKDLYGITDKPLMMFPHLVESSTLRSWLNRLSDIADYQKQGDLQKVFVDKILEYLELADKDPAFCDAFYCVIEDASTTCGDRVALSVLDLGIIHKLATINLKDIKTLADFLIKGPWTIELLKEVARNIVPRLPFFDELEVYLAYPIKLKQELNIPIDVQEMLYFTCSALQEKDLQEAKAFVLGKQRDQEARFEFLINHDKWKEALSVNYKEEYQAILDKKTKASESDNPDYRVIEEQFNQELMRLTKKALDIL